METSAFVPKSSKTKCMDCVKQSKGPFCNLSEQVVGTLDQSKTCSPYARGQILFQEGNPPVGVYCVETGLVKLYKIGVTGKEQILRIAGPGELLGYRALIAGETYAHFAEALVDSSVCFMPAETVRPLLRSAPDFLWKLLHTLLDEVAEMEARYVDLSQMPAEARLILFLLRYGGKLGRTPDGKSALGRVGAKGQMALSRQEIADCIGAAPETVIRTLSRLQKRKLIRVDGRAIEIPDPDKLHDFLHQELLKP